MPSENTKLTVDKSSFDKVLYPLCAAFKSPNNGVFNIILRILDKLEPKGKLRGEETWEVVPHFELRAEHATFEFTPAEVDLLNGILEAGKKSLPAALGRKIPAMKDQLKPEQE